MTENNPRTKGASVVTRYSLTGRPVYPIPHDGVPFEFENQPPEMTHTFRSDAFYRAPDSSAVAFADSVMDKLSMVTVQIKSAGPSTLVLPVDVSGVCEPQVGDNADYPILPDTHIQRGRFWKLTKFGSPFRGKHFLQIHTDELAH